MYDAKSERSPFINLTAPVIPWIYLFPWYISCAAEVYLMHEKASVKSGFILMILKYVEY